MGSQVLSSKEAVLCLRGCIWKHVYNLILSSMQVIAEEDLKSWSLYLVDWGYNTAAEQKAAKNTGRIYIVDKQGLEKFTA